MHVLLYMNYKCNTPTYHSHSPHLFFILISSGVYCTFSNYHKSLLNNFTIYTYSAIYISVFNFDYVINIINNNYIFS